MKHLVPSKDKRFWPSANNNNSWKWKSRRENDSFSRRSSWDPCASKRYCRGIKDLIIFCADNDQKEKNKAIQTSQNNLHELCHSKKKSRTCWMSAWKIRNKSTNDWEWGFLRWSDFSLQIPINSQNDRVYFKDRKEDFPDKNFSHQTNKQSVKVMVSATLTWFGVTKPLFVN